MIIFFCIISLFPLHSPFKFVYSTRVHRMQYTIFRRVTNYASGEKKKRLISVEN